MKKAGEPLGPRPAPAPAELPASRAAVLGALTRGSAVGLAEVAQRTGLHANTVREHLDALVAAGLAERRRAAPVGRGRPAWLYAPTDGSETASPYAVLAATLATALATTSGAPQEDAARAGTAWGRDLVRGRDRHEPRVQVAQVLGRLGFAPEAEDEGRVLRLTRCPLLDAAREHPDVVCAVHLGIVRGALAELGAEPAADLFPFSEPGACRLELP